MPSSCPVCEQPIASTATHCAMCGFPTALAIEGLRSLDPASMPDTEGDGHSAVVVPPLSAARTSAHAAAPSSREAELNEVISRDLRTKMDLIRELGRGPDVTSELCQAALIEAEGRVAEALDILRTAQSRLDVETDQLLRQRCEILEQRQQELQAKGVRFAVHTDLDRLSDAIESGDREAAVTVLIEVERRFAQFESDWRGLQGLLAEIEGLHREASELQFPLGEISGELEAIQDRLRDSELTEESLDAVAQEAAQTLMLLHEAIPASLEVELKRGGEALDELPEGYAPAAVARRLHVEAGRHLRKGRLSESIQNIRELRRELAEAKRAWAAPPVVTAPAPVVAQVSTESDDEMLDRLLKKARSLAGRVRSLPLESEASREAAAQIRDATDLLRVRKLREADETLTRLMRVLATDGKVT